MCVIIAEEMMKELDSFSDHLVTIYRVMNQKTFGFRFSATIVGGRSRLERLIAQGLIRAEKSNPAQNGKWQCNASDVLRNAMIL